MNNKFEYAMSKRTDEELNKIISSPQGDYQQEAVEAAKQEIKKRQNIIEKLSKYSDEQILEILTSKSDYQEYEIEAAEIEVKKRKENIEDNSAEQQSNLESEKVDDIGKKYDHMKPTKKSKIKKGFAIVNIFMGVVFIFTGVSMSAEQEATFGFLGLLLGLTLLIVGWVALNTRKREIREEVDATEETVKVVKIINTICFVISILILMAAFLMIFLEETGIIK